MYIFYLFKHVKFRRLFRLALAENHWLAVLVAELHPDTRDTTWRVMVVCDFEDSSEYRWLVFLHRPGECFSFFFSFSHFFLQGRSAMLDRALHCSGDCFECILTVHFLCVLYICIFTFSIFYYLILLLSSPTKSSSILFHLMFK